MTIYEKDESTGVISLNCGDTASFTVAGVDGVIARNADGRVMLPSTGKAYAVKVEYEGVDYVVATGLTNTPTNGKATPIWVRVRAEPEATIPDAPAVEELD